MELKRYAYVCIFMCFINAKLVQLAREPAQCKNCQTDESCRPPLCFCCRDTLNLPMSKREIPQIVFFTFDDALTSVSATFYHQLFNETRKNPNGCPISMTMFISHQDTEYRKVNEFYRKGMEIAAHSVTHAHMTNTNFREEAKKQKQNLARLGGLPEKEIVGWRSPFLEPVGDMQPSKLKELGYVYDATLTYSKRNLNDKAPTPFTLDFGWPYDCKVKPCPRGRHNGFWEVPVVSLLDYKHKYDCVYVDGCNNPPPDESSAYKFLMDNFNSYYKRSRVPFGINMHSSWFHIPERLRAMDKFIQSLLRMDDVYIVSVAKMIKWLKNPTPLSKLNTFEPWKCKAAYSNNNPGQSRNKNKIRNETSRHADRTQISQAEQRQTKQYIEARLRRIAEMRKQIENNRMKFLQKRWRSRNIILLQKEPMPHNHRHNSHQNVRQAKAHSRPKFSMRTTPNNDTPNPAQTVQNSQPKISTVKWERKPVIKKQVSVTKKGTSQVPFWQRESLGSRRSPEVVGAESPWWKQSIPKGSKDIRDTPTVRYMTTRAPWSLTRKPPPQKIHIDFEKQLKEQVRQRQKMIEEQKIRQKEQLRQQKLLLKKNERKAIERQQVAKQTNINNQLEKPNTATASKKVQTTNSEKPGSEKVTGKIPRQPWQRFVTFLM